MNIPVLMYHKIPDKLEGDNTNLSVQASVFEKQVESLKKNGYSSILPRELAGYMAGKGALPKKPVIITFDDALESVGQFAKPILDRAGYRAAVFVVAHAMGVHNFWDDGKGIPKVNCMDIKSIRELVADGWEAGSHGLTHISLPQAPADKLNDEITGSKEKLEKLLETPVCTFCYPFGAWDENVKKSVIQAGYTSAYAITVRTASVTDDMFAVKRVYIKTSDSLSDFRRKISPWYLAYRSLRKR